MLSALRHWCDRNILELGRELRLSYLPPLLIYLAFGFSAVTNVVGTFFVKDYLGLSAALLAALGFWAVIPWSFKMVIGHLVDLLWRWKSVLVFIGAALIAASLSIMVGLISERDAMVELMPASAWYVTSVLLAPLGYVLQDSVADAMTVEAVPRVDADGKEISPAQRKLMHTTMQTLGRVALIGGTVLVAFINLYMFAGAADLSKPEQARIYRDVYLVALAIPPISILGILMAMVLRGQERRRLRALGWSESRLRALQSQGETAKPNWWILGGGLAFVALTIILGFGQWRYGQEIIFAGSLAIVIFLIARLTRELDAEARTTLLGTAIVIFAFRAAPTTGPGVSWWMIDELAFDQQFFSVLGLIAGVLTLFGMFIFRRFMAERSITYVVGFLTLCGAALALPTIGMYYGLHHVTQALTGGIVDARFIALIDTALESPLGQIAMIPMLAWIARSAPANLKATYFAVMASFTNLALSFGQLGTKYLNELFAVAREVRDPVTGAVATPADYSELGMLMIAATGIGVALPFAAIWIVKRARLVSA